jgi:homoprotocatechuate degradation regulator HpaR
VAKDPSTSKRAARGSETPDIVPYKALPEKLQRARAALLANFRPIFANRKLTDPQWRILRVLQAEERIDTAALAKRALILGPSLSRILKDLEQRRLISKKPDSEDGRRYLLSISPAGRRLIDVTAPELDPVYCILAERMTAANVTRLNLLLDELLAALEAGPGERERKII